MAKYIQLAVGAILSPEKIFKKLVNIFTATDRKSVEGDKFFVDADGSVILNRHNTEVQKSFAENVAGLTSKKKG